MKAQLEISKQNPETNSGLQKEIHPMNLRIMGLMIELDAKSLFVRVPLVGQFHLSPLGLVMDPWSKARLG